MSGDFAWRVVAAVSAPLVVASVLLAAPAAARTDSDGDGTADVFENLAGTDPLNPNSYAVDVDADGFPDFYELDNGSDPDDPNSVPPEPAAVTSKPGVINVSWTPFIGGIRATVSMTNNKGQVGCNYSTKGLEAFDRRFTLFDEKPTDVTILAPPLLHVWPVTITCDNGVKLETERFSDTLPAPAGRRLLPAAAAN